MTTAERSSAPTLAPDTSPLVPLPLAEWEETKDTLHRYAQIAGKIRLALTPHMNHWWNVTLYVTSRGLTTGTIPYGDTVFSIDFDFVDHELLMNSSAGRTESFALHDGLSVAQFYERLFASLKRLGIDAHIHAVPYDLSPPGPFADDTAHASYSKEHVQRFWRLLVWVDSAFKEFSGRFTGKQSPVHLFWHSFDLALGRFSGERAPDRPGARLSDRHAYSHEIISFGFWAGDQRVPAPAFYSYTAPEPPGLADVALRPAAASWVDVGGSHMAMLMYDDLRALPEPRKALLEFLESAYTAGARTAGWDIEAFTTAQFAADEATERVVEGPI